MKYVLIYLLAVSLLGCAPKSSLNFNEVDVNTNICDVVMNMNYYHNRSVTVSGILFTDWRERTGLISEECPDRLLPFISSPSKPDGYDEAWQSMLSKRGDPRRAIVVQIEGVVENTGVPHETGISASRYKIVSEIPTPEVVSWFAASW